MVRLDYFAYCVTLVIATSAILADGLLVEDDSKPANDTVIYDFNGTCALKAWISVAGCRKDFIDRMPGKGETGLCCLYLLLDSCAHTGAAKLCGKATDQVKAQYMRKYAKMIGDPDCSDVRLESLTCFWIAWENYVSSAIFCVLVFFMIFFVIRWYARQAISDAEYRNM